MKLTSPAPLCPRAAPRRRLFATLLPLCVVLSACGSWFGQPTTLSAPPDEAAPAQADTLGRLDRTVLPLHYDLDLSIDPSQATLAGQLKLQVELTAPSDRIRLHGAGLLIDAVQIKYGDRRIEGEAQALPEGLLELRFPQTVPAGQAQIFLKWRRGLTEAPRGVYRLRREETWFAFTRFEPSFARSAIPCFDQPEFKAPWQLTIRTPKGELAVANAPETSRNEEAEQTVFFFAPTPPLPPHLLAFAVGDLEITPYEPQDAASALGLPPLRVVSLHGRAALARGALNRAAALLRWLQNWTALSTPYEKLDLLAVPDFPAGALESPGLLTFRESVLLFDDDSTPDARRLWGQLALAHELAHLWFGDSVTPLWWDDLWLSEGLSTWLGTQAVAAASPELEADLQSTARTHWVMSLDEGGEAAPVRRQIANTHAAEAAFDRMTYAKGAALTRMAEGWLGADRLQQVLRQWLRDHQHGHSTTAQLLSRLDAASQQPVSEVLQAFLDHPGVPHVRVQRQCAGPQPPHLLLTLDTQIDAPQRVPVCLRLGGPGGAISTQCVVLGREPAQLPLSAGCPEWVHPNADQRGYYRWSMPTPDLLSLVQAQRAGLSPAEQVALPGQLEAMVEAGQIPLPDYAQALTQLAHDQTLPPLALVQVVRALARLRSLVPEAGAPFAAWVRDLLTAQRERLESEEGVGAQEAHQAVYRALAYLGQDRSLRTEAMAQVQAFLAEPAEDHIDEIALLLPVAAWSGDEALWQALVSYLHEAPQKSESSPVIRVAAISALGSFEDPTLLRRSLGLLLDGTLDQNDFLTVTRAISDAQALQETWLWLTTHHAALVERLGAEAAPDLVWVAAALCSEQAAEEVDRFFSQPDVHEPRTATNARLVSREIRRCAALRTRFSEPLLHWLSHRSK